MKRFDRKKASEYFIVAWVKDWRMHVYLNAIGARDVPLNEVHDLYPWMPPPSCAVLMAKNSLIRGWVARSMPFINNKLWDTGDPRKRLALAKEVERFTSDMAIVTSQMRQDRREMFCAKRDEQRSQKSHQISVELMRRGSGSHWNVVK